MTAPDLDTLRAQLERHEGRRRRPYKDSRGILTVGIGRNLEAVPFSDDEIDLMCDNDVARAIGGLTAKLPWFAALDAVRQRVLINMAFNLGVEGLLAFHQTLDAVRRGDYAAAAAGMGESLWARQVGIRAVELKQMMATGEDVHA